MKPMLLLEQKIIYFALEELNFYFMVAFMAVISFNAWTAPIPTPTPLVKLIIEGVKPWPAHPLVSTKTKHPQHALGGQSPLLWTPEADGHSGLFLHIATCVKECLDTPRMASRKRVTICCPKGQLYKEDGFRHALSHVYKSAWMKTGQPPLEKKNLHDR